MPQMDQMLSGTKAFQTPILACSLGQLTTSFGRFFAGCTAMYLAVSLWITRPTSVLAAGFLVRIFIIHHDCGHGSFFRSRWANELIGSLCRLIMLTPYAFWRQQNAGTTFPLTISTGALSATAASPPSSCRSW
jgi:acyl-lipid omega-6 desaturase (Delta-12 desaturase)